MFSRHTAGGLLTHITGRTAIFAEPMAYVALYTTAPSADDGTGAVEVSGGGYARVPTSAATWGPAGAPPPLIANAETIAFPTATANWGAVLAAGLYDAAAGGNLLIWDWLGAYSWRPCTLSAANPAVVTLPAHGLGAGAAAAFTPVFGGTTPSLIEGSLAGLLTVAGPIANDTLTLLNGGTAVNTSSTGGGMLRPVVPQSVPAGVTLVFWPGALALVMGGSIAAPLQGRGAARSGVRTGAGFAVPLAARSGAMQPGRAAPATTSGSGAVLGTGTSGTDALGTGTSGTDLLGVV